MKPIGRMAQPEIASMIQSHLAGKGIEVVLSGGALVAIYSTNAYVSKDVDLVNIDSVRPGIIAAAMQEIGFREEGRYFRHPDSDVLVEFPPGPLAVGAEPVKELHEIDLTTGSLEALSPTDCVKDRLASYYHWGDRQALAQAILVTTHQRVDLSEIARWSEAEGKKYEFLEIRPSLTAGRAE